MMINRRSLATRTALVLVVLSVGWVCGASTAGAATGARRGAQHGLSKLITVRFRNSLGQPMPHRQFEIEDMNARRWTGTTDANGNFAIRLGNGRHSMTGRVLYTSGGRRQYLNIWGSAQFRLPSAVRTVTFNFKTTGKRPGYSGTQWPDYYGGAILVGNYNINASFIPPSADLNFTLVPQGLLADGTRGSAILAHFTYADFQTGSSGVIGQNAYLYDIPLGTYTMQAEISWPGFGTRQLRVLDGGEQDSGGLIVFDSTVALEPALAKVYLADSQ